MKLMKQILVAVSGLAILVAGLYAVNGTPASAAATPIVKVVNTPAEAVPVVGNVRVHNGSANPLNVDIANAVGASCDGSFDAGGVAQCNIATIPEGQILVIEEVTCGASVLAGARIGSILLGMGSPAVPSDPPVPGIRPVNHTLVLTRLFSVLDGSPQHDYYGLTNQVKMYAFGGLPGIGGSSTVFVNAQSGGTLNTGGVDCTISGHMLAQ
jgi:hypothetical protein